MILPRRAPHAMPHDEAMRARQEKWRREGFAHEADMPDLPVWVLLPLIAGLGTVVALWSPVWLVGWIWRRLRDR